MLDEQISPTRWGLIFRWVLSIRPVRVASMLAAMILIFLGEYQFAHQLTFPHGVAWAFPIALDMYAMWAFHQSAIAAKIAAVAIMVVCQGMSHLIEAGLIKVSLPVVIVGSAVAPIVYFLVHQNGELAATGRAITECDPDRETAEEPEAVSGAAGLQEPVENLVTLESIKPKRKWSKGEAAEHVAKLFNVGVSKRAILVEMGWTSMQRVNQVLAEARRRGLLSTQA